MIRKAKGNNQRMVEADSPPPSSPAPRDIKKKDEQSTVGQIAKFKPSPLKPLPLLEPLHDPLLCRKP